MKHKVILLIACMAAITSQACAARNSRQAEAPAEQRKAQPVSDYKAPLIQEKLRLSDFAGMEPRPELKDKLLKIS